MKNFRLAICLMLFLLSCNNLFSQNDYKPGYVITNSNDTINGWINLKANLLNSSKCEFKKMKEGESKSFSPEDIIAYRIEDSKYYIAKTIEFNGEQQTLFLEYLLNGIVKLYYLKTSLSHFYFIEKDNEIHLISNEEKEFLKNDVKYSVKSNQYKGVLSYLFKESPEVSKKVNNTRFNYSSLIKVTQDYHNSVCTEYDCTVYSKKSSNIIFLQPYLGSVYSVFNLEGEKNITNTVSPKIGVDFRIMSQKVHYLWNLLIGINYSKVHFNNDYEEGNKYEVDINYSNISFPLKVEYSFPADKWQPFLYLGYNAIFNFNKKDYEIYKYTSDVYYYTTKATVEPNYRTFYHGFTAGLGLRYKFTDDSNIFLSLDYNSTERGTKTGFELDYQKVKAISASLGYSFRIK